MAQVPFMGRLTIHLPSCVLGSRVPFMVRNRVTVQAGVREGDRRGIRSNTVAVVSLGELREVYGGSAASSSAGGRSGGGRA